MNGSNYGKKARTICRPCLFLSIYLLYNIVEESLFHGCLFQSSYQEVIELLYGWNQRSFIR